MASIIVINSFKKSGMQTRVVMSNIWGDFTKYYTWNSKLSNLSGPDTGAFFLSGCGVKPVRLAYVSYENRLPLKSNAPPIIIMHDIMDSKCHWVPVAQQLHLRSLRKVFTVDMRNHGESYQASPMTYVHISEDIKKFMDEFGIQTAALIGHGMGGRAAMALALRYPHSVDRLAVIDASPNTTSAYHIQMSQYLDAVKNLRLAGEETSMVEARRSVERQLAQVVTEDIARYILTQNLIKTDNDGKVCFYWRVNLESISANLFNISTFPTMRGRPLCNRPALFIHGANEDRIPGAECVIIQSHFPNSQFAQISQSGYFVQSQNPSELVALLMGFLTV